MVEVTQEVREAAQALFDAALGDMASYAEYGSPSYREGAVRAIEQTMQAAFNAGRASVLEEVTISEPDMSGCFEGDIWFGHPKKRTLGTHIWRAGTWHRLPSEVDAVISLLAKARKQRDAAIEGLVLAVSALERGTHQDFQDETRQEITAMIGAYKEAL